MGKPELHYAFELWAKGGVLTQADGEPRVFWHGTRAEFTEFDRQYNRTAADFYFTKNRETAEGYGPAIPCLLRATKVFNLVPDEMSLDEYAVMREIFEQIGGDYGFDDAASFTDAVTNGDMYQQWAGPGLQNALLAELRHLGFDAVRMVDAGFRGHFDESVVVFEPDQICRVDEQSIQPKVLSSGLLKAWEKAVQEEEGLQAFDLYLTNGGNLKLQAVEVAKNNRKEGRATAAMRRLCALADECGLRIVLTPGLRDSHHGTTSRKRLVNFYKRFDFVENRGRRKDCTVSEGMLRDPKAEVPAATPSKRGGLRPR